MVGVREKYSSFTNSISSHVYLQSTAVRRESASASNKVRAARSRPPKPTLGYGLSEAQVRPHASKMGRPEALRAKHKSGALQLHPQNEGIVRAI